MAYPDIRQSKGSQRKLLRGVAAERAIGGKLRKRVFYPSNAYEFTIMHKNISKSDKESIVTHFNNNYDDSFNFTWAGDSTTYTVEYLEEPRCTPLVGSIYWDVEVRLGTL